MPRILLVDDNIDHLTTFTMRGGVNVCEACENDRHADCLISNCACAIHLTRREYSDETYILENVKG